MKRLTAALVDVNFDEVRRLGDGDVYVDPQGNRYLVLHGCTSTENAVVEHLIPHYLRSLVDLVGPKRARMITDDPPFILGDDVPEDIGSCPPELIDVDWFMMTFKDGVRVEDGVAVVRFNEMIE